MRELTVGLMVDVMSDVMTPLHDGEDGGELLLCFFEVPATFPASTHHCVGLEGVVSVLAWSPMKSKHHSFLLLLGVCDFSLPAFVLIPIPAGSKDSALTARIIDATRIAHNALVKTNIAWTCLGLNVSLINGFGSHSSLLIQN